MGQLNNKILFSTVEVAGFSVQPYKATNDRPFFGQRVYVPFAIPQKVDGTFGHQTAPALSTVPAIPASNSVPGVSFDIGAPEIRGNNAPVYGGS